MRILNNPKQKKEGGEFVLFLEVDDADFDVYRSDRYKDLCYTYGGKPEDNVSYESFNNINYRIIGIDNILNKDMDRNHLSLFVVHSRKIRNGYACIVGPISRYSMNEDGEIRKGMFCDLGYMFM